MGVEMTEDEIAAIAGPLERDAMAQLRRLGAKIKTVTRMWVTANVTRGVVYCSSRGAIPGTYWVEVRKSSDTTAGVRVGASVRGPDQTVVALRAEADV